MKKMQRWLIDLEKTGKALIVIADSPATNGVGWIKKRILPDRNYRTAIVRLRSGYVPEDEGLASLLKTADAATPPVDVLVRYFTGRDRILKNKLVSAHSRRAAPPG